MKRLAFAAAVVAATLAVSAYAQSTPPPPPLYVFYDLNHDGKVDDADLAKFAEYWIAYHTSGAYNADADFNGDNVINYFDAMQMIEGFLRATAATAQARTQHAPTRAPAQTHAAARRAAAARLAVEALILGAKPTGPKGMK